MTAPIEFKLRAFAATDIAAGTALVAQSGWNQLPDDWRIFLELGEAIAVEAVDGRVVATAAILPHGPRFAWISMVLVDLDYRRRGIATRLLEECIERLQRAGRIPVLDATPAGRSVYAQLGFRDGWAITRWEASCTSAVAVQRPNDLTIRPIEARDWDAITAFDAPAFGVDRSALLRRLHARSQSFACAAFAGATLQGFALGRDGARATYVGPIVARDDRVATALAQAIVTRIASVAPGLVYLDALDAHPALAGALTHVGFRVQRPYTRMALGSEIAIGDSARVYAIAGPELG